MKTKHNIRVPRREGGAILVVGLILLLVMTVLGISTMSTASLELSMAGNDQFSENAFQLAETGIDTTMAALNAGAPVPAPLAPGVCPGFGAPVAEPAMNGTFDVRLCYQGVGQVIDESSLPKIVSYHFVAESRGNAQDQATSWHHQGLFISGPDGL